MNLKYISSKLEEIKVNISDIDIVFVTHTHIDHISGLKKLIKDTNACIYLTEKMYEELGFDKERSKTFNYYNKALSGSFSIKKNTASIFRFII